VGVVAVTAPRQADSGGGAIRGPTAASMERREGGGDASRGMFLLLLSIW